MSNMYEVGKGVVVAGSATTITIDPAAACDLYSVELALIVGSPAAGDLFGQGGGGGGAGNAGAGGAGGAGGRGSGGGGGGAARSTYATGAGGVGGDGWALVVEF